MRIESFLRQSPVFQVSRAARRMEAMLNRILRDEGVAFFEALVLAAIFFEKKGGIKPSELAETFQMSRSNVSHCITSLEAKALVRRRTDAQDARGYRLMLLPAGRKRAARVVGIMDRIQGQIEQMAGPAALESMMRQMFIVESLCAGLAQSAGADQRAKNEPQPE